MLITVICLVKGCFHPTYKSVYTIHNINGKVFNIIREIYSKAKSCIRKDTMLSDYYMMFYV